MAFSFSRTSGRRTTSARPGSWFRAVPRKDDPLQERIECLIGPDVTITGDLVFAGGLRIDGRVNGVVAVSDVQAGTLLIGDEGCVRGDVRVSHLIVYGRIEGTVFATGLVDLRANACVAGDVFYGTLEMQAGAVIEGQLVRHKGHGGTQ